jgi:membrane protease YdiL (CAAX protease family)
MDLSIGNEFYSILTGIFIIVILGILAVSLYEFILPSTLNNTATGITTLILLIIIGVIFYFIPDNIQITSNKKEKNSNNRDTKYIVYLLLLTLLTLFNVMH